MIRVLVLSIVLAACQPLGENTADMADAAGKRIYLQMQLNDIAVRVDQAWRIDAKMPAQIHALRYGAHKSDSNMQLNDKTAAFSAGIKFNNVCFFVAKY